MEDYERKESIIKLMAELEKGRSSGEKDGWHSLDEVRHDLHKNSHKGTKSQRAQRI